MGRFEERPVLYGVQTSRRRDAQRNRAAIVEAATQALTGRGSAVPLPEIARRAGVGQATLYRHFPDRHALVAAVVTHHLERLEALAAANAEHPETFEQLLREVLTTQVAMRPLVRLVERLGRSERDRYGQRMMAALAGPLRRAQDRGHVRGDLVPQDVLLLIMMVRGAVEAVDDGAAARTADRTIELVLEGVRRKPATP
jgi:AcrR family transcriptional regulator